MAPQQADVDGFTKFMESYVKALPAERAAIENF